jgi:cell division protein ZapE
MQHIHKELELAKGAPDPVRKVAEKIARETRLLCFDEFHVSDIADAMILGRLLAGFQEFGIVLVMTSNYPPEKLYPNGLNRERFLPAIARILEMMDVVEVDAGIDYRFCVPEDGQLYLVPDDDAAEAKMAGYFNQACKALDCANGASEGAIEILGREIPVRAKAEDIVWFDFEALCGGFRSQNDYLEIARAHHTVLLSHIPKMGADQAEKARRFTWLVDVLYEYRVKLMASAAVPAEHLFTEGAYAGEFVRTVSRLVEMDSSEYLALPHLTKPLQ